MTLALTNVGVCRGSRWVLRGASLTIAPGAVTAIIGPNGAGKSTLLRAAAGDLNFDEGAVQLDGRNVRGIPAKLLARRRSVLGQEPRAAAPFTVREIVAFGLHPRSDLLDRDTGATIVNAALRLLALEAFADRRITELSGGEARRVHLARTFAQVWYPKSDGDRYVLLDEPVANLDLKHQHAVLQAARDFAAGGAGLLIVLHDLLLASRYADVAVLMANGRIVAQGPPADVLHPRILSDLYEVPEFHLPPVVALVQAPSADR